MAEQFLDFDYRAKFSKKADGTLYNPWRNNNIKSNISNYLVHASSIEIYNKYKKKVKSYIIKMIDSWIIVPAKFVKKDKFKANFYLIGIVPQFRYWLRSIKDYLFNRVNKCINGKNIFHEMVNLEKYDLHIWWIYENKLKILFDKSQQQIQRKIKNWEKLRTFLSKNEKVTNNESIATVDHYSNLNNNDENNNSPPDWELLKAKLKNL